MTANSVVLPAPFGPISAGDATLPGASSDASFTATSPPKRLVMRSTSSITRCSVRGAAAAPGAQPLDQAQQPVGREGDDQHEQGAEERRGRGRDAAGHHGLCSFAERMQHDRAEQRPEHGAEPADDRREQRLDRDPAPKAIVAVEKRKYCA